MGWKANAAAALGVGAVTAGLALLLTRTAPGEAKRAEVPRYEDRFRPLEPLHRAKTPPQPGEWLAEHPEPGQSFEAYQWIDPVRPDATRTTLYIRPLGDFGPEERAVLEATADFMARFFCLPVRIEAPAPLAEVPPGAQREHPAWGTPQILTTWVLDELLRPARPADAVAYLALTSADLWPGGDWNFVFGQASLRERVGVWSIHRNGNAAGTPEERRQFLLRTLKTAVHETGHMLSVEHCVKYECVMNGSNHQAESDSRPLALCPVDQAKITWNTRCDPVERLRRLAEFAERYGLIEERTFYERSATALGG